MDYISKGVAVQRYSLTKSGVCDCMYCDNNGQWVKYADAIDTIQQAHRQGWEQLAHENINLEQERDRLKRELAEARAELASYKAGVEAWVGTEHLHYIDCQCYWCRGEEKNEHQRVKVLVRAKDGLL